MRLLTPRETVSCYRKMGWAWMVPILMFITADIALDWYLATVWWALLVEVPLCAFVLWFYACLTIAPVQEEREMVSLYRREFIDLDREPVRLNDPNDATSLLYTLSAKHGAVVHVSRVDDVTWAAVVKGQTYRGPTPLAALQAADSALK